MSREEDDTKESVHLDWRDYVAIIIASFETTLLPILVVIAVLILLALLLRL
ncbi:MAG: hypothetical protein WB643_07175 [Candidatus Bathyarchaeia archaeon]